MTGKEYLHSFGTEKAAGLFKRFYGEEGAAAAKERYRLLVEGILRDSPEGFSAKDFPEVRGALRIFSAPGRTELGGNHTDHNRGKVLAASVQLDAVAVVAPRNDSRVFFRSVGHPDVTVDISSLPPREEERGTTEALIRGIAASFAEQGTPVGGFTANAASTVLTGSGLSSSAAVEVLFAKIFDNLYCEGKRTALALAQIGQKAENVYFGKPSGLMDQAASASGGAVAIDFAGAESPLVTPVPFDPAAAGLSLCVVNTKGSHADLVPDYAAIPREMKKVAAFFGKDVLREIDEETLLGRLAELRLTVGDRAILRALHFFGENRRVFSMVSTLEAAEALPAEQKPLAMRTFLALVRESGDSSWELLQNVYSPKTPAAQGLSLALAVTKRFLGAESLRGACRVHGGGFAGTIQVYLPAEKLGEYRALMEGIFGAHAVTVLRVRPFGAVELDFS